MKHQKEGKMTFTVGGAVFKSAHTAIFEIFQYAHIEEYQAFLRDILLYSSSRKRCQKYAFGDLISYLEYLSALLTVCFVISKQRKTNSLDGLNKESPNNNSRFEHHNSRYIVSNIVGSLTPEEFANPYKALKKVFRYRTPYKWSILLNNVTDHACANYRDDIHELNTLEVYQQLCKLLEAAYLIYDMELE